MRALPCFYLHVMEISRAKKKFKIGSSIRVRHGLGNLMRSLTLWWPWQRILLDLRTPISLQFIGGLEMIDERIHILRVASVLSSPRWTSEVYWQNRDTHPKCLSSLWFWHAIHICIHGPSGIYAWHKCAIQCNQCRPKILPTSSAR
jgi:hypothetical protein